MNLNTLEPTFLCKHERWLARVVVLADGRPSLREFCFTCGKSSSGSRLGFALPMIADVDIRLPSFKHTGKKLGEIAKVDLQYLKWLVIESKTSDRIKKSAARIYCGVPYTPPVDGAIYESSFCYLPSVGWDCVKKIQNEYKSNAHLTTFA